MRLPRVRFTLQRMMIAVAVVAVIVAVAVRAADLMVNLDARVASRFLAHTWTLEGAMDPLAPPVATTTCAVYSWPRFWRGFLGRPWPGGYVCECAEEGYTSIGTGAGTASRRYRLRGTRAVSREEGGWTEVSLLGLKTIEPIGGPLPSLAPTRNP